MSIEDEVDRLVREAIQPINSTIDRHEDELSGLRDDLRMVRDELGKLRGAVTPAVMRASEPIPYLNGLENPPLPPPAVVVVPIKLMAWAVKQCGEHLDGCQYEGLVDADDTMNLSAMRILLPRAGTCPTCTMPYHPSSHTEDEPCPRA